MNEKSTLDIVMSDRETMESGFLEKERVEIRNGFFGEIRFSVFVQEVKQLGYITGPMVAVNLSEYFLQIISIMMIGHLDKLSLSSTSIAISFCAVFGFSLLYGLASALDTLCGQAFGAKQYRKLGIQTGTAILFLILFCIPVSLLLVYMEKILIFMGQDPQISKEAGKFATWLIPALFAYGILQPLVEYFQAQSLITPLLVGACASVCCHVPLCWILVFKTGLRHLGAALSIGISYWLNVILLVLYMKYSPACETTRVPISSELFGGFREFLWFAFPAAVMACLDWWSFDLLTLLAGFLPNPELETSVLSVCLSIVTTVNTIPEGLGAAGSTRVSNELGNGNARAACAVAGTVVFLAVIEAVVVSSFLSAGRSAFGYIFSNEEEVVDYVTNTSPLICLLVILKSLQCALSGIARGCGWQDSGALVNLGAYYIFGLPVAAVLAFWLDMRGKGLWIGILAGSFLQAFLLFLITIFTNWEEKARLARKRIFKRRHLEDDGSSEQTDLLS